MTAKKLANDGEKLVIDGQLSQCLELSTTLSTGFPQGYPQAI